jgi:hypothetical protein
MMMLLCFLDDAVAACYRLPRVVDDVSVFCVVENSIVDGQSNSASLLLVLQQKVLS